MKVRELIALLQKENPEAQVIKFNDGGTTQTSLVAGVSRESVIKPEQDKTDEPKLLIE